MFDYKLEHVFSYNATLSAAEIIGPVPDDIRVNFYVTGGKVWLPDGTVIGDVLPVGGDWLTIRRDNSGVLDVRATVKTTDGALLYVVYNGLLDLGQNGYDNLRKGKLPAKAVIRAAPRITTSHPNYAWANTTQFLNVGEVEFGKSVVQYDVYAVR
jgi:hypothetical protein